MVQRIQTLYLFLASTALAMMFFLPIYNFVERSNDNTEKEVKITIQGRFEKDISSGEFVISKPNWARSFMTLVVGMGLFVNIFQYTNRKRQLLISRILIIANFVLMGIMLYDAYGIVNGEGVSQIITGYAVFMPTISVILTALAARAIKKDEELVRSADRLR